MGPVMGGGRMEPWDLPGYSPVPWRAAHPALNQILKAYGVARREVNVNTEIRHGLRAPFFWHTVNFDAMKYCVHGAHA